MNRKNDREAVPLLLKFKRLQRRTELDYGYDEGLLVNVLRAAPATPVMATSAGLRLAKTLRVVDAED